MAIVGDSKAYVLLKKHGALVKELPNRSVTLTLEGRVYIVTFLMFYDYLTKGIFNEIALLNETAPALSAYTTGKMLRFVCEKWLKDHKEHVEQYGHTIVPNTDLNYRQVALLLELLIAAQGNLERAAEGKESVMSNLADVLWVEYPEDVKEIKEANDILKEYYSDFEVQALWKSFSSERYAAQFMELSEGLLAEFNEWLDSE